MNPRRGFTLVEALIALALGLLVCYTAFAGFSAASRAIARSNRIALQTQLMVAGVSYALNEIDTWASCNTPSNPTSGLLYLAAPNLADYRQARPFNRLTPTYGLTDFRPDDRRWWYRYAILNPIAMGSKPPDHLPDYSLLGKRGDAHPAGFLHDVLEEFDFRLGHYAMFDYWPPGLPIGGATATGDSMAWLRSTPSGYLQGRNRDYELWPIDSAWTDKQGAMVGVVHGEFAGNPAVTGGRNRLAYGTYDTIGGQLFSTDIPIIRLIPMRSANPVQVPAAEGPPGWPDLRVQIRRYVTRGRFYNMAVITLLDPNTGAATTLRFTAPGSSLRGARLNRQLDP